ncbi:STAS/SEC14 domain-containing protein [Lentibacter sp. XHP0401]|uniref:STAS/SEC14 domain-containing protein n=1 Tax=Lentibacter sp. XHP0401 TaxID=2984334 RepID=UPI0021E94576|nr:STAS/SEC14 domain-containing protein [Lentibacter sp. XHP0401]MCV2892672.1 STAS/SEC14 domain-containing protein [Lentibacter sp. XHP0401]
MSLVYSEDDSTKTAMITVSGKITKEDYDTVITPIQAFIDKHGSINFIEVVESFAGFEPSVLWPGIKFDITHLKHIDRVAVVSDIGWISPITKAAGYFMSTKLRMFDMDELDEAKDWVKSSA